MTWNNIIETGKLPPKNKPFLVLLTNGSKAVARRIEYEVNSVTGRKYSTYHADIDSYIVFDVSEIIAWHKLPRIPDFLLTTKGVI